MNTMDRRSFMATGMGAMLSQSLLASSGKKKKKRKAQAKQVLVIFEQGGVSQMDTFDPKPLANAIHRSPFKSIKSAVPGIHFTELMSRTAKVADKMTIVRSMYQAKTSIGNSHPLGSQYLYSGQDPLLPVTMPDIGSVVANRLGSLEPYLPAYVREATGTQSKESRLGFLPAKDKSFAIKNGDVGNLVLNADQRRLLHERRALLAKLNGGLGQATAGEINAMHSFAIQAEDMLTNPKTALAFDISKEPEHVRKLYHPDKKGLTHRGSLYLLGRKLIESGVRFVTIDTRWPGGKQWPGGSNMNWDHHDAIYSKTNTNIKGGGPGAGHFGIGTWPMMGSTDWALSGLITDMDQRGLLDDTLVCFVTELGRTPKINERQGRDHWVHAFSFAFAGAGVPRGHVVGETDKDGSYITSSRGYRIEDYAATIYAKLGIDAHEPIHTPDGRPMFIAKDGNPIPELFS